MKGVNCINTPIMWPLTSENQYSQFEIVAQICEALVTQQQAPSWSGQLIVCLFVTMGCTPSIQDNTEVTETSQEDAQKIVERVYSAKKGRILSMKDIEGFIKDRFLKLHVPLKTVLTFLITFWYSTFTSLLLYALF